MMKTSEFYHILAAILVLWVVSAISFAIDLEWDKVAYTFLFSALIISVSVISKKITANLLDADVEHEILEFYRFGFYPSYHLSKPIPLGIILPLIASVFSLGSLKVMTLLTYEARALKYRAAKRFGFYSFKEMTDWHHAVIGASGILFVLLLSMLAYLLPLPNLEYLAKLSAFYAFWNMLPLSKLDGSQIFFGSRILWTVLFSIATIFSILAVITP